MEHTESIFGAAYEPKQARKSRHNYVRDSHTNTVIDLQYNPFNDTHEAINGPFDTGIKLVTDLFKNLKNAPGQDPYKKALSASSKIYDLLYNEGLSEQAASYGTYATYHETDGYSSSLYRLHNNASGIKFKNQKGAVKGANNYAYFPDGLQAWAAAYYHELTKGSNPSGAKSIEDFATRLKANGYYEDSVANYVKGMKNAKYAIKDLPDTEKSVVTKDGKVMTAGDDFKSEDKEVVDKTDNRGFWQKIVEGWGTIPLIGKSLIIGTGVYLITKK